MSPDLKERRGNEYNDDWKPGQSDSELEKLEKQYDAPSAAAGDLPASHPDKGKLSSDELKSAEKSSGESESPSGLKDRIKDSIPYREENGRLQKLFGKKKNKGSGKAKKKAIFAAAAGGGGLLLGVLMVLLLLNALKIQNLAQHVLEYNMLRTARSYRLAAQEIASDRLVIDGIEKSASAAERAGYIGELKAKYGELRSSTWGKFDKYRPAKVLANLQAGNELQFVYTEKPRTILPGTKLELKSVLVKGQSVDIAQTSRFHIFKNAGERIRFSTEVDVALSKASPEVPSMVRSRVAKDIQKNLGIKLSWWEKLGKKYSGLSRKDAFKLEQQTSREKIGSKPTNSSLTPTINDQAKGAADELDKKVKDGTAPETDLGYTQAKGAADSSAAVGKDVSDALPESTVATAIENAGRTNAAMVALQNISSYYQIALPICMVFDGSTVNPEGIKKTVDSKNASLQRSFYALQTAADQQKAGATSAEALGAFSDKIGNIKDSPPELRAAGKDVDTTQFVPVGAQPQAGPLGPVTLANVVFGNNSAITGIANNVLGELCPLVLDPAVVASSVALEAIIAAYTLGQQRAVAQVASEGAERAATTVIKNVIQKSIFKRGVGMARKLGKDIAVWGSLTVLAKMLVLNHMSGTYDGLSTDKDFATETDMGGNLHASELQRRGMYGRPMKKDELQVTRQADVADMNRNEKNKSFEQRYFALSNANSLLARMGYAAQNSLGNFKNSLNLLPKLLNPISSLATSAGTITSTKALAQKYATSDDYGITQFGWTEDELAIIQNNKTYSIVENAEIVERNVARYEEIEKEYGDCFTESLGTLIAEEWVKTDESGDVIDGDHKCSPQNLGISNPKFSDQVFRWRVKKRYDYVLDHQLGIQEPTVSDSATNEPSSTVGGVAGCPARPELEQQVLNSPNIAFQSDTPRADVTDPSKTETDILCVVWNIATKGNLKIAISVFNTTHSGCPGGKSNHCRGYAADIGDVGTPNLTGVFNYIFQNKDDLKVNELIFDPIPGGTCLLKQGNCSSNYSPKTIAGHRDHVHVAVKGPGSR